MIFSISSLVLVLIALGWRFRRDPKRHVPCMVAAFVIDLGLLLYVELTRHAIEVVEKNLQSPHQSGLLLFHVSVSTLTLILYGIQLGSGLALVRKLPVSPSFCRTAHRTTAYAFVTCRLLNYVTSFFVSPH